MTMKTFAYATLTVLAASAFVLGSAATGEAKGKKMAAPPPQPQMCFDSYAPVCGSLKGQKVTYANACSAYKDGATVLSNKACATPKKKK